MVAESYQSTIEALSDGLMENQVRELIGPLEDESPTVCIDPDASPAPVHESVDRLFENQPVTVRQKAIDQTDDIVVIRDDEIVAASSAEELLQSVLLVNSDVYITGEQNLEELEVPDVLKALEETPLRLRGYPESNSEKLLFILFSRKIEQLAYEAGNGTLRVGFQRLSRLVDEPSTRDVYEQLTRTDLDIHAYGAADTEPPPDITSDITVNSGDSRFHRRCWFVVFEPTASDGTPAGLFAVEQDANCYEGFWTFQPQRVESLRHAIEHA